MSFGLRMRLVLAAAVILPPATLLHVARSTAEQSPHASLAGQFLIASPDMGDPRFERTVILLVEHNPRGAFGIVVNRPMGERPLADVLRGLGGNATGIEGTARIFWGGPVQPQVGFVVHTAEYRRAGTIDVDGRVAMTSSLEVLQDIATGKGPEKSLLAFGYAGWEPGSWRENCGFRPGSRNRPTRSSSSTKSGKPSGTRRWRVARAISDRGLSVIRLHWLGITRKATVRPMTFNALAPESHIGLVCTLKKMHLLGVEKLCD